MKKLFIIPSLILTVISSASFAKSEGTYIGLDIIQSNADLVFVDLDEANSNFKDSEDNIGYGLNVGHAISLSNVYDGLYIAPNAYFNVNEVDLTISGGGVSQTWEIKNSYGINIDFGYDISDKLSIYASTGYVEFRLNAGAVTDNSDLGGSASAEAFSYGFGIKYNIDNRLSLRLAYDTFSEDVNGPGVTRSVNSFDVDVMKLGVAFNF